jgi:DNA-binding transcriptional LysR family regulator
VAIGSFIPNQSHLIQKKLFDVHTQFFASRDYLLKYGIPHRPEDLDHHRLITYRQASYYSSFRSTSLLINVGRSSQYPRQSHFQVDSLHGMISATLNGYGISELPDFPSILNSGLQLVLPQIKGENIPLHYIFHKNRKNSQKIKVLYDFLMNELNSQHNQ